MDVPPEAALVCDFINTVDFEDATETFVSSAALARWLRERGLLPRSGRASDGDLVRAISLRENLRIVLDSDHRDADIASVELARAVSAAEFELGRLSRQLPLVVDFATAWPRLSPLDSGAAAGLAAILAAIAQLAADGSWPRVKVCSAASCRWAYFDTTKNRSRTWCTMRLCGNRAKTASYRARQRSAAPA